MSDAPKSFATNAPRSGRGFAARLDKQEAGYLCYVQTKDETGYDAFYFLLLSPEKEEAFNAIIGRPGQADLQDYGVVVASGYGRTPHKGARDKIMELYGLDALALIEDAKKKRKSGE
jgi:hypothetical protein